MIKKLAIGVGILIGVAHIGALGHLMKREDPMAFPLPPAGEYTSYRITATRDGYTIEYIGNDPKVLTQETDSQREGWFGGRRTTTRTEYTQDGARNRSGDGGKLSAEQVACIEAAGGGRSNGALVGTSVAASAVPFVTGIPYIGWLAAGWVTMFGADVGGDLGAEVASTINGC